MTLNDFLPHLYLAPSQGGDPVGILWKCLMLVKLEWLGYRMVKKLWRYVNGQTDGQTDLLYQYRASVCWRAIITNRKHAKRIQWDNFLWPLANRNPDFKIHRILSYALASGLLPEVTLRHSVNNSPVKRLPLVGRLPPAFYIVPHADWNYGIVTPFFLTQNWDVGYNVDQLDLNRATVSALTCSLVRCIYSFFLSLLLVLLLLSSYLHEYPCFTFFTMASHYCINRPCTASLLSTTDQYFI